MSLDSKIAWNVEGANWNKNIAAPIDAHPSEVATRAIESLYSDTKNITPIDMGIILMVSHEKMKSADDIYVCHTPTILANAGLYNQADELQSMIDKLLKH